MNKYLKLAEKYARDYDRGAAEQSYYGPEIMFGLMFEYLREHDRVLDIAIGTGLDAALFKKAGSRVYGIDGALEMLKICREKNVVDELKQVDLMKDPIPYPDAYFDLAVANSIFHMIENPASIFKETSRVLKKDGIFGFNFDEWQPDKYPDWTETRTKGVFTIQNPESGLNIYRHTDEFIRNILEKSGFVILKNTVFLSFRGKDGFDDFYFTAYLARKK